MKFLKTYWPYMLTSVVTTVVVILVFAVIAAVTTQEPSQGRTGRASPTPPIFPRFYSSTDIQHWIGEACLDAGYPAGTCECVLDKFLEHYGNWQDVLIRSEDELRAVAAQAADSCP